MWINVKVEVCVVYDTGGDYMYLTVTSIFILVISDCGFVHETSDDYVFDPCFFFFKKIEFPCDFVFTT